MRADTEGGGFIAIRHPLQLGHRRIAHITDLGAYTTPALTSTDHLRQEPGRLAADAVLHQLQGRVRPPDRVLPVRPVVRRSCGERPAA